MKNKDKLNNKLNGFLNRRRKDGFLAFGGAIIFAVFAMVTNYGVSYVCKAFCIISALVAADLIFLPPLFWKKIFKKVENIMLALTRKILRIVDTVKKFLKKVFINLIADKAKFLISSIREAIRKIVQKLKDKFSLNANGIYKGARIAKEYVDVKEKIPSFTKKASKKRRKKYKDMDNIEKIRFLYEKKITGAMKKGIKIEENMTPGEAGNMLVARKYMNNEGMELIDNYNIARYDDEAVMTDDVVERVKRL